MLHGFGKVAYLPRTLRPPQICGQGTRGDESARLGCRAPGGGAPLTHPETNSTGSRNRGKPMRHPHSKKPRSVV